VDVDEAVLGEADVEGAVVLPLLPLLLHLLLQLLPWL
jgi:hypothetical protein